MSNPRELWKELNGVSGTQQVLRKCSFLSLNISRIRLWNEWRNVKILQYFHMQVHSALEALSFSVRAATVPDSSWSTASCRHFHLTPGHCTDWTRNFSFLVSPQRTGIIVRMKQDGSCEYLEENPAHTRRKVNEGF